MLFIAALKEKILSKVEKKLSASEFNSFHPTIKFTADLSKEKVNFLDVEVTFQSGILTPNLLVKLTIFTICLLRLLYLLYTY